MASAAELAILLKVDGAADVDKAVEGVSSKLGGLSKMGDGLSSSLMSAGKIAAVGVAGIATAAIGVGGALLAVGGKFDDAFDGMAVKTGATGAALEGLQDSFKNVIGNTPADFETVSAAMGTLSQRTGATGADLEALTTQVADLSRITGVDATAAATAAADVFAKFGTATADQGPLLDQLFTASQQSGVGFDQLAASVSQFAPQLQAMGMGAKDGAAMIASLAKSGIDASAVMPGLSKAIGEMVKKGIDPVDGLTDAFDKIKTEGAQSETAMKMFGKSGLAMAQAISTGAMNVGDMIYAMDGAESSISKTAMSTADFGERMDMMKNKVLVALEPLGSAMMDGVTAAFDKLMPVVDTLTGAFSDLTSGDMVAFLNDLGLNMDAASKYGEPLQEMFDTIKSSLATASEYGMGFSDTLALILGNLGFEDAALTIADLSNAIAGIDWVGIGETVAKFAGYFMDGLGVVLPIIAGIFTNVLLPVIMTVFNFFKEHTTLLAVIGAAFLALTGPIGAIVVAFTLLGALGPKVGEWVTAIGSGLVDGIGAIVGGVVGAVTAVVDAIIDTFCSLLGIASPSQVFIDFGINLLQGLIDGVMGMIATVVSTFGMLHDAIVAAWEAIKESVMATVEMIRVMISAKWDAIGEYLGGKIDAIGKVISDGFDAARAIIETMVAKYLSIVTTAWSNIFDAIDTALGKVRAVVDTVLSFVEEKTGISMEGARKVVSDVVGAIQGFFDGMKVTVSEVIGAVASLLTGDFSGALDGMKRAAESGLRAVMGLFSGLGRAIGDAIGNAKDMLLRVGGDIIEGLKAGISNAFKTMLSWLGSLFDMLPDPIKKALGIHSPSSVMRDEVGIPIGMGIIAGMQAALDDNPIVGIVAGWATANTGGFAAKLITPIADAIAREIVSLKKLPPELVSSAGTYKPPPELVSSRGKWAMDPNNIARFGLGYEFRAKDPAPGDPNAGRIKADAFRSGKGGLLAASSSNYWQVFVAKWGVPTEASCRKVSAQLGIEIPQWLLDIYNPPPAGTVDPPDVMKDPSTAQAAGEALTNLAKAAGEAAVEVSKFVYVPLADLSAATIKAADAVKVFVGGMSEAIKRLPGGAGGGVGGPIGINPPPGGSSTFGGGGSGYSSGAVMLSAQTVNLAGPVSVGFAGTFQVGGGRSLAVELVDALIADTGTFDKLIKAEDRRRAQKP